MLFAALLLIALPVLGAQTPNRARWAIGLALLFLFTQVAFYAGAAEVGRYMYPAVLAGPVLWVLVADRSWSGAGRSGMVAGRLARWSVVALLPSLVAGLMVSYRAAETNAATTEAFHRRLLMVEQQIRSDEVRVVVLEPYEPLTDQEAVLSLARYLTADLGVTVMTLPATHRHQHSVVSSAARSRTGREWTTRP